MVVRRRAPSLTKSDELRDYFARLLRSDDVLDADDREMLAQAIERFWLPDPMYDKRLARHREAKAIQNQLDDFKDELDGLVASSGMSASQANRKLAQRKQTLAEQHGHLSVDAFRKWMRDNLPRPSRG